MTGVVRDVRRRIEAEKMMRTMLALEVFVNIRRCVWKKGWVLTSGLWLSVAWFLDLVGRQLRIMDSGAENSRALYRAVEGAILKFKVAGDVCYSSAASSSDRR